MIRNLMEVSALIRNNCYPIVQKHVQGQSTHNYAPLLEGKKEFCNRINKIQPLVMQKLS